MTTHLSYERYQRQLILKNFGEAGQQKLLRAAVLVIGAGGLGCPVLQYLAAAGVGRIGIVDDDNISLSNLHRQVLYNTDDIGRSKANQAAVVLSRLNTDIEITPYTERLTVQNAFSLMKEYDIIVDCTDNFAARYLINDACVLLKKPLVFGAVSRYEGQVAIFNYKSKSSDTTVNYRDLYPQPPKAGEVLSCEEAGVLGVLPGIIGSMQATEVIKLIAGIGRPLINRMLTYDALDNNMYELELAPAGNTASLMPGDEAAFLATDYNAMCGVMTADYEIDTPFFDQLILDGNIDVIDVREPDEVPVIEDITCLRIPLGQLPGNLSLIHADTIVVICQTGRRSLQAAKQLATIFGSSKKIYSVRGGIMQWKQAQEKQLL